MFALARGSRRHRVRIGTRDAFDSTMEHETTPDARERVSAQPAGIDPVCGMPVDRSSPYRARFEGHDYAFCSEGCLDKFDEMPEAFTLHPLNPEK